MSLPPPWEGDAAGSGQARQPPPYRPDGPPSPYGEPGAAGPPPSPPYRPSAAPSPGPSDPSGASGSGPGARRPARWWERAAARAIDGLAVGVPVTLVALLISLVWAGAQWLGESSDAVGRNASIVYGIAFFALFVAYETVCVQRWRRTLGKHLLKLEVAPVSAAGCPGPIPVAAMAARAALFNLAGLASASPGWAVLLWMLLLVPCVLLPLWDRPYRQGLHDKLGGTVVVHTG